MARRSIRYHHTVYHYIPRTVIQCLDGTFYAFKPNHHDTACTSTHAINYIRNTRTNISPHTHPSTSPCPNPKCATVFTHSVDLLRDSFCSRWPRFPWYLGGSVWRCSQGDRGSGNTRG